MTPTEHASPAAAICAILAGGRGSRLGGSKATATLAGRPLIGWALAAARAAGLEPIVVAKADTGLPELRAPVIREPAEPAHPLVGLVMALEEIGSPLVVVGCDTPFLPPGLLAALAVHSGSVVAAAGPRGPEPLIARYEPLVLPALRASLAALSPLRDALAALEPVPIGGAELAGFGDPRTFLFNVNTPADLERAEELSRQVD